MTLCEHSEPMKRGHDQRLPMVVSEVMSVAGVSFADVKQIAVCVGPGSFTGIRVGVAFARGLALANNLTAIGVSSLEALVGTPPSLPVLALIPARLRLPDQSFWAQIVTQDSVYEPMEVDADKLSDLVDSVGEIATPPEGAEILASIMPDKALSIRYPKASGVALWAVHQTSFTPRLPSPLYVREPDATPARSLA